MVDNDSQSAAMAADGDPYDDQHGNDDESSSSNLLFSCQCDSARKVATLLSCLRRVVTVGGTSNSHQQQQQHSGGGMTQSISAAKSISGGSSHKIQHVTVYAGPDGLTFHVQHGLAKQAQCSVDLPKTMFRDYYVGEEEVWVEDSDDEDNDDGANNGRDGVSRRQQHQQQRRGIGGAKEIIQGGEFSINLTTVLDCFSILSKTGNKPSSGSGGGGGGGSGGSSGSHGTTGGGGEYASLSNVPLCMSYDRGTATLHLELLESGGGGGGCLVTCEVPGVAVADDVDDGPEEDADNNNFQQQHQEGGSTTDTHSGLATAFRSSPILTRAILCSDALQSAVAELYDVPGAKIVNISLSTKGLEFGTIGPRSEVWVNVPYHRGQGGLYVGLESYNRIADDNSIVRRYPLGAFLSGMRGLDIGVETCISVNARGIMAIQHQVSRDEYVEHTGRPSFVDFIMTCIEDNDEEDDNNDAAAVSQEDVTGGQHRMRNGLQDITNTESLDEEIATSKKSRVDNARSRANEQRANTTIGKSKSSSHDEEEQHGTRDGDSASPVRAPIRNSSATSRLLDELEVDKELMSSRKSRAPSSQGRKDALEDIRRRRHGRQQPRRSLEDRDEDRVQMSNNQSDEDDSDNESGVVNDRRASNSSSDERKRLADNFDAGSRKNRRSEDSVRQSVWAGSSPDDADDGEMSNSGSLDLSGRHSRLAQDTQSQSEDDDGDETELEDAIDVTAEVPMLFSKRTSMSTTTRKSNGWAGGKNIDSGDNSESEMEQEPRMMYGDTKLEFTQDSYDST
ncbi:hypothetical protein ACHAXH_006353 [Discostella pseudostelligera]